ncbi:MAG: hypothetical protein ABIC40_00335, partial [bacterium]
MKPCKATIAFLLLAIPMLFLPGFSGSAKSQHTPTWSTDKRDLLSEALESVDFTRADLGYRPEGYWARFPVVPYKLHFFDDLFSEPMRVYDYTRTMGNVVENFLDPELSAESRRDGVPSPDRMHQLISSLAIERRVGGFRSYSTNLLPRADEETPILDAIRRAYTAGNDQLLRTSFGSQPTPPNAETDITDQLDFADVGFEKIIAELILNALDAAMWREIAVRNIPAELMDKIYNIKDFAQTQGDGIIYYPEVDDAAGLIDEQSMAYAAVKLAQATEDCRYALEKYMVDKPKLRAVKFETMTPFGRIVIGSAANDVYKYDDYFVLVDLGGNDRYEGPVGATTRPEIGISTCLDLNGNDVYDYDSKTCPSQGAGVFGVGVLYDASGN